MARNQHLFIFRFPPPYGGGEIVSQELYNNIRNVNNYRFVIINYKKHSKSKQSKDDVFAILRGIVYILKVIGGIIKHKPQSIYLGIPKTFGSFLRTSIIIILAKLFKIEIYGEIHGMTFHFLNSSFKKKYFRYIINKVSKIRVLGISIEETIRIAGYRNKVYVINNGVSIPKVEKHNYNTSNIKFLYLGAISRSKGFFKLIKAFKQLVIENVNNWSIDIVGEWVNIEEEKQWHEIYKTGVFDKNKIMFHGKLTGMDKWNLISKCDYLVHLTDNDGQPLAIIEAMGLGIPTIATRVGAIPEMISHKQNGFLVQNDIDTQNILKNICFNVYDYSDLSTKCVQIYLNKYTPDIMANSINEMIIN